MGIFDFLKRQPPKPKEDDEPSPHYVFAHYALRMIALQDPIKFLAIVSSPDALRFIDAILKEVGEQCGRKPSFDAVDVSIHPMRVHGYPCAVIELPKPENAAEAFMVALVVAIDTASDNLPYPEQVNARYFTLEKGFSLSNEPRTVLAEWDAHRHSNYGDGPLPAVAAFAGAIERMLD